MRKELTDETLISVGDEDPCIVGSKPKRFPAVGRGSEGWAAMMILVVLWFVQGWFVEWSCVEMFGCAARFGGPTADEIGNGQNFEIFIAQSISCTSNLL
jgi:hypothetical protein